MDVRQRPYRDIKTVTRTRSSALSTNPILARQRQPREELEGKKRKKKKKNKKH
jgi:hypothetical protein